MPLLFSELEKVSREKLLSLQPIEIVFVNDGSQDRSWELIIEHCHNTPGCVGVNLSRNFGHQLALTAGMEVARGNTIVSLDADLQDPPEVIAQLYTAYLQGYDVVYATRRKRGRETFFKRVTARLFYALIEKLAGVCIPRDTGDFRLLSRRAVTELSRLREPHRFLRGLVPWIGLPQTQVLYDRADRRAGQTHYPFRKMLHLAVDGIVSMSAAPLRLAYVFCLLLFSLFVGYIFYVIDKHLVRGNPLVPGWTSIMCAITIFGTIQLLLLGVIGEYLGRIYEQSKNRPLFIVQEIAYPNCDHQNVQNPKPNARVAA